MAYPNFYNPYPQNYYTPPMQDQLAQLRQNYQPQQMQQPIQQNQQTIPVANQQNGIMWVNSKMEADNYFVTPNSAVALWDVNYPVVYLRQADSTGKPTTKVYDITERVTAPTAPATPIVNYVTREEYDALAARVDALAVEKQAKPAKKFVKEETDNG